mgnify:FL=1
MKKTLAEGDAAPDFTLNDKDGIPVSLSGYRGKWVVLYFYPRDNTSGCTTEAKDFSALLPQFEKKDAVIIGISADSETSHAKFITKHELTVTLLSDPDHQALEAYGVWQEKKMYGKVYMGIVRSSFLIDEKGRIAAAWYKISPKNTIPELMKALEG